MTHRSTSVAARLEGRSPAWRLGASTTAAIGIVLTAWALSVDFAKASSGFAGDAATYYTLGHSLAHDLDFEYRRDDLVRVWKEFPSGPEGIFLKRGSGGRHLLREGVHLSARGGAVHLAVRHQRLPGAARAADDGVFRVRLRVPGRAQSSGCRADLRVRVPVRIARAGLHGAARPGLLHLRDRAVRLFLLVLQGSRRPAGRSADMRGGRAGCSRRAPTSSRPRCSASRRLRSRRTSA